MNPWEGFEDEIFGMSADELNRSDQGRRTEVSTQFLLEPIIILASNTPDSEKAGDLNKKATNRGGNSPQGAIRSSTNKRTRLRQVCVSQQHGQ
jgi:hypothetical protein